MKLTQGEIETCYLLFYDAMYAARKLRGMTQTDVAELIGVSRVAIAMYESGRARISARNAVALAAALGLDLDLFRDASPLEKDKMTELNKKKVARRQLREQIKQLRRQIKELA